MQRSSHRNAVLGITAALAVGLALGGCTQGSSGDEGTPSATAVESTAVESTATPTPSESPTTGAPSPTSTSSEAPVDSVGTVPDSCTDLITAGKWDDAFASAPLNDPAVVGDPIAIPKSAFTPALQGDGTRLFCVWKDPNADITNLSIGVDVVDPTTARAELDSLATEGYDCGDEAGGYRCQKISQNPQYPVTDGDTYFTRGELGIHIQQSNTETSGLLADVIAHTF